MAGQAVKLSCISSEVEGACWTSRKLSVTCSFWRSLASAWQPGWWPWPPCAGQARRSARRPALLQLRAAQPETEAEALSPSFSSTAPPWPEVVTLRQSHYFVNSCTSIPGTAISCKDTVKHSAVSALLAWASLMICLSATLSAPFFSSGIFCAKALST